MNAPPDPAELAERYRECGGEFVSHIIEHVRTSLPEAVPWLSMVRYQLLVAFDDARTLDERGAKANKVSVFLQSFMESVFNADGFYFALFERALLPADRRSMSPVHKAMERGEDTRAAWLLVWFREKMKDGWPVKDALRCHGKEIGELFAEGNDWLLERLSEAARKPYRRRSAHDWIVRAWLPLALWQEVSADEKVRRLHAAWKVQKKAGVQVPDWPEENAKDPYPVQALIRRARSTVKRARR